MSNNNLKQKAVKGVIWTSIQRFMTIFIQFVSGIILARLLAPEDYGCIGMLSIFILVASTFIDGGFGSALIQKKRPTQDDYSTIFYWNIFISLILYVTLFFSAPVIARFYQIELLVDVLRVQGVVLIFNAFSVVQVNLLNKQFRFKKISIVNLSSSVVSLSVTIWMAYRGYGVWALVTQNIIMSLIPALIYWTTNKWLPSWAFSWSSFKTLFNFGFYMFLTSLLSNIVNNVQGLLIGRFYNPATMGYYSKARSTEMLAATSISQVISQVSFPLYSELQDNKSGLITAIKKLTQSVSYITFPLMFLLILTANPLFSLLYSDKWLLSVPYFQFLCIAGLAICLQSVNFQVIAAIGKGKAMFVWSFIKQILGLCFMLIGLYCYGIWGLLVGMVMRSYFIYVINASLVSKYVGYKLHQQLCDLLPVVILSAVSFVSALCTMNLFETNKYLVGAIGTVIFIVVYLAISVTCKMTAYNIVFDLVSPYVNKLKRKIDC